MPITADIGDIIQVTPQFTQGLTLPSDLKVRYSLNGTNYVDGTSAGYTFEVPGGITTYAKLFYDDYTEVVDENGITLSGVSFGVSVPIIVAPVGATAIGDYSDTSLGTVGSSGATGFDSDPISRWNVAEYQEINEYPYVGLVSFHINEIDKVEFSCNGGTWTDVTEMTFNPSTNVYEYWVAVDQSGLTNGDEVELRAKITPKTAGQVYGIDPIKVRYRTADKTQYYCSPNGNDTTGDGTEGNPFATVEKAIVELQSDSGGGSTYEVGDVEIILMDNDGAGATYELNHPGVNYALCNDRWFVIRSEDGASRENVQIVNTDTATGILMRNIKYQDLTFYNCTAPQGQLKTPQGLPAEPNIWFDNVLFDNDAAEGETQNVWENNTYTNIYVTDCDINNVSSGPRFCNVLRNTTLDTLYVDAVGGSRLVANFSCVNQVYDGIAHPDFTEVFDSDEHSVFYGVVGLDIQGQGIYGTNDEGDNLLKDIAFVNFLCVDGSGVTVESAPVSQLRDNDSPNLLLQNIIFDGISVLNGQSFILEGGTGASGFRDITVRNSILYGPSGNLFTGDAFVDPIVLEENNYYIDDSGSFSCVGGTYSTVTPDYSGGDGATLDIANLNTYIANLTPTDSNIVDQTSRSKIKTDALGRLRMSQNIGAL